MSKKPYHATLPLMDHHTPSKHWLDKQTKAGRLVLIHVRRCLTVSPRYKKVIYYSLNIYNILFLSVKNRKIEAGNSPKYPPPPTCMCTAVSSQQYTLSAACTTRYLGWHALRRISQSWKPMWFIAFLSDNFKSFCYELWLYSPQYLRVLSLLNKIKYSISVLKALFMGVFKQMSSLNIPTRNHAACIVQCTVQSPYF